MKNLVLYHKHCADGSCAALAAYLSLGDDAEYVADIAEKFGGGGHRCAAGFRVDL
jgi:hypothetical protein